jgi:predicted dehydrogenase
VSAARTRVAVIGAGWWATQAHLPALRDDPDAEVVAVADRRQEQADAAAAAYGVPRTYTDHRRMLEQERPDGVVVAAPHTHHYALARDALEAGAGVLVEKPMTLDAAEAEDLVALAERTGLPLMVGYTWHFNPMAQALRAAIAAGRLGDLQLVSTHFASRIIEFYRGHPERYRALFDYPVTAPGEGTYSTTELAGGGQGQTQVTHAAGLLFWLTGLAPTQVFASMERFDVGVDLVDAISLRLAGGVLGTISSTGGVGIGSREILEYRIHGTEGCALLDLVSGAGTLEFHDGTVEPIPSAPPDQIYPLYAPAQRLVELLRGAGENLAPGALGAMAVGFVEAAYRSARENAPVAIPPSGVTP